MDGNITTIPSALHDADTSQWFFSGSSMFQRAHPADLDTNARDGDFADTDSIRVPKHAGDYPQYKM